MKNLAKLSAKNLGKLAFSLLIILSLFLPSCFNGNRLGNYLYTRFPPVAVEHVQVYPVYLDKDFGEADRLQIADAIDQWNYALNGNAKLVIVDTKFDMQIDVLKTAMSQHAFIIFKIDHTNPLVPDNEPGHWSLAFTPHGTRWVYLVRDRLQNQDVKFIVMHELGHALGADHRPEGLMFHYFVPAEYQCVDYLTVIQVARHQGWDVNTLNYCTPGDGTQQTVELKQPLTKEQQLRYPTVD